MSSKNEPSFWKGVYAFVGFMLVLVIAGTMFNLNTFITTNTEFKVLQIENVLTNQQNFEQQITQFNLQKQNVSRIINALLTLNDLSVNNILIQGGVVVVDSLGNQTFPPLTQTQKEGE